MGRRVQTGAGWGLLLGIVVLCGPVHAHEDRLALAKRMQDGSVQMESEPYPGSEVGMGVAHIVVDASRERVLKVVRDYAHYPDFMPHFQSARVLAQRGTRAIIYLEAALLKGTLKVWAQLKVREAERPNGTHVVEATMTKGNVEHMAARWEITRLDETHCLVSFGLLVAPDLPLPASVITTANMKSSRRAVRELRAHLAARAKRSSARAAK